MSALCPQKQGCLLSEFNYGVWASEALIRAEKHRLDLIQMLAFLQTPSVGVTLNNQDVKSSRIAHTQTLIAGHDTYMAYLRDGAAQTEKGGPEGSPDNVNI